jgi:peptide/nickel transport system substrate-binding protein
MNWTIRKPLLEHICRFDYLENLMIFHSRCRSGMPHMFRLSLMAGAFTLVLTPGLVQAATLHLGIAEDALTLDPIASSDNPSIWTELLIFDQLVRPSSDGLKLEPGLAEKWDVAEDGKSYTFHLRANAQFSNGDPVTASDVVFSLKRASGEKSEWARFFKPITGYEIIDSHTVRLTLDTPFTPLLNNLALFSASILPQKAVTNDGEAFFSKPVGSGPFVVEQWNRGEKMLLSKNAHYWQLGKPMVDHAEIQIIGEDNSRVLKLKAGELDAVIGLPFNQISALKADPRFNVGVAEVFRSELVQLNTRVKPLDDVRVRQALNYAIDKEGIVKSILRGNGKIAASSLPIMAYHDVNIKPYDQDLDKAKKLLGEAGVAQGFKVKLLVPSGDMTHRQVASVIQSNLARIGVQVELQTIEGSSQYSTTKAGNYEMSLTFTTSDTIDPDQLVGFTAVNPERANALHTEWKDPRVNELYELERRTLDGPERGKQFKEIENLIHDGAPFIFLYHQGAPYASSKKVEGFSVLPTSNYRLEDVKLN